MKPCSTAAQTIIESGSFKRADLYDITLAGGSATYHLTSAQTPLLVGTTLYQTGYVLKRGPLKSAAGLQSQPLDLTLAPNANNAVAPPLIAGYSIQEAAQLRVFDNALILYSKLFLNSFDDLSPGAVPWYLGQVNEVYGNALSVKLTLDSVTQILNNQGPPNIISASCSHVLFDAGCGLRASDFQVSGVVTSGSTDLNINTGLTQPDGYFTLGRLTFTSGPNATSPSTTYFIKQFVGGQFQLIRATPNPPGIGDAFVALPGCPKTRVACSNTSIVVGPAFNNLKRFRGYPYVPVPETLYDGGTSPVPTPSIGGQGGSPIGSVFGSGAGQRNVYKS